MRRKGDTKAETDLFRRSVSLQSECEAVVEVADELERMTAGGEA